MTAKGKQAVTPKTQIQLIYDAVPRVVDDKEASDWGEEKYRGKDADITELVWTRSGYEPVPLGSKLYFKGLAGPLRGVEITTRVIGYTTLKNKAHALIPAYNTRWDPNDKITFDLKQYPNAERDFNASLKKGHRHYYCRTVSFKDVGSTDSGSQWRMGSFANSNDKTGHPGFESVEVSLPIKVTYSLPIDAKTEDAKTEDATTQLVNRIVAAVVEHIDARIRSQVEEILVLSKILKEKSATIDKILKIVELQSETIERLEQKLNEMSVPTDNSVDTLPFLDDDNARDAIRRDSRKNARL